MRLCTAVREAAKKPTGNILLIEMQPQAHQIQNGDNKTLNHVRQKIPTHDAQ